MARRRHFAVIGRSVLSLGLISAGVLVLVWWPLPEVLNRQEQRVTLARVIESVPCGQSTAGDLVEFTVDGISRQARFDGCGHAPGERLRVAVPTSSSSGQGLLVQRASSDQGPSLERRLDWVLLTLAGISGAGYALLLRSKSDF